MIEEIEKRIKEIEDKIRKKKDFTIELKLLKKEFLKYKAYIFSVENRIQDIEAKLAPARMMGKLRSADVDIQTLLDSAWNNIVNGNYKEAVKVLKKARALSPNNEKVHLYLGWAFTLLGKYNEAMAAYQNVLKKDPFNQLALTNIGFINYKLGIYGEAIERLSKIIKENKDRLAVLYANFYLGIIYYEREMYFDAIEFFNKAIKAGPNLFEAYYYLGKAYMKSGNKKLGDEVWDKLLSLKTTNIWSQKIEEERNG